MVDLQAKDMRKSVFVKILKQNLHCLFSEKYLQVIEKKIILQLFLQANSSIMQNSRQVPTQTHHRLSAGSKRQEDNLHTQDHYKTTHKIHELA